MVEKMKRAYGVFCKMIYIITAISAVILGIVAIKRYFDDRNFHMSLYNHAVEEFLDNCNGYNIEVADYKKEYVNQQTLEYHDFGCGELRYNKYAVTVPVEYDTTFDHISMNVTIVVYHYQPWNMESVGDIPDSDIKPHIYVEDMFMDIRKIFGE